MPRFENPLPDLKEAGNSLARIVSLQADVFLLRQELKTLRQIKQFTWLGASLILLNLFFTFTFYWLEVGLHERGWSAYSLAFISILFFGLFILLSILLAFQMGKKAKRE